MSIVQIRIALASSGVRLQGGGLVFLRRPAILSRALAGEGISMQTRHWQPYTCLGTTDEFSIAGTPQERGNYP